MDEYSFVPVDHQPDIEDVSLVPVDHDPLGGEGLTQQAQAPQAQPQHSAQLPATGVGQPNAGAPADHRPHSAPGDNFPSAEAAAIAALQDINSTSQLRGLEYAGRIYHKWLGFGDYSYTAPAEGTPFSSSPGNSVLTPLLHSLGVNAGTYHTHARGIDPTLDENYSPKDKHDSDGEREPYYLGAPSGNIYKYAPVPDQPTQGRISVLGHTSVPVVPKQP